MLCCGFLTYVELNNGLRHIFRFSMTNDIFSGNEIDGGEVKQINRGQNKQSEKGNLPQGTAIGTITIERDQLLSDLDCRNAHQGRNDVGEEKEAEQLLEQDAFLFPFPDTQPVKQAIFLPVAGKA